MNVPNLTSNASAAEVGARFRAARDAAGLSRAQVAKLSNVSAKAIEKFEAGQQEPSFLRFAALCEAVGKPASHILNGGDDVDDDTETQRPTRTIAQSVAESADDTYAGHVRDLLFQLDELREGRFRNAQRRATALIEEITSAMRFLEAEDLVDLARDRDVFAGNLPAVHELENALINDPAKGQELCRDLERRIVDTALLGADIYAVDLDVLAALAKRLDLDRPMFGWSDHDDFAGRALEPLRARALAGQGVDLGDEKALPGRS